MKKSLQTRIGRAMALGLSATMMSALALVGATPAVAAPGPYSVSGVVETIGDVPMENVKVGGWNLDADQPLTDVWTSDTGAFELLGFAAGDTLQLSFTFEGYGTEGGTIEVEIVDQDVVIPDVLLLPTTDSTGATAEVAGVGLVGETLTVTTTGWPAGTVFTYQWFAPQAYNSGDISGATGSTYVVTEDEIGRSVRVFISGGVPGVSAPVMIASSNGIAVTAPKKAAAPAPADLDAYLLANGSTPQAQTSTGLPSGALNPGAAQTANLDWFGADSFVDVYVFSSPVFVGTFPVVNGVAQITLSTAVLGQLAAGNHTLVATGQSSGAVLSVALSIGLPVTGVDVTLPVTVATVLVLLGGALMLVRRRFGATI